MVESSAKVARNVHAEAIAPGLASREWSVASERRRRSHAYLLLAGSGEVRLHDGTLAAAAPCAVWLPHGSALSVRLAAGASGFMLAADDDLLTQACESSAEGLALASLSRRVVSVGPEKVAPFVDELAASFAAVVREARQPQPGSRAMIVAPLGLLLLQSWRLSGAPRPTVNGGPERSPTVERFCELVELHFAEHWPVSRYVAALGMTEDRLHSVCSKETGRGPLALIHARVIKEARLRLERSAAPIEKIAARLGFADPGYFNRFFKKQIGMSPGAYRRNALDQRLSEGDTFAAWP